MGKNVEKKKVLIAFLIDEKKENFISKINNLNGISVVQIKKISEIKNNKFPGLIIDWANYVANKKHIIDFCKNNMLESFKIFLVLSKIETNENFIEDYEDISIYSIIPDSFEVKRIQTIFDRFINDYKNYIDKNKLIKKCERQSINFNTLTQIGISLSVIRDIDVLLDLILTKSREITHADAGSIYLVEENIIRQEEEKKVTEKILRFVHTQNHSFSIKSLPFTLPISKSTIVGYSAFTGNILNIPDAHKIPVNSDYTYSVENEKKMKVHNRSIVVVPMKNQKDEIIGVIQLFNKKKNPDSKINDDLVFEKEVIPFDDDDEQIVESLASQAAVSLENSILYKEIKTIFEGFIKASVFAIEARDPTTSGHSERVAILTKELGRAINDVKEGSFAKVYFNEEELKVIEYAGLLHDFGKIGVREQVLVKAKKLYPEELEFLKMRYDYLRKTIQYDYSIKKIKIIKEKGLEYFNNVEESIDLELKQKLNEINDFVNIILKANEPTILEENNYKIISGLIDKSYLSIDGENIPFLEEDEKESLIVLKGSLTEEQRKEIESHVTHSFKFLCNIPWTKEMSSIPHIVYKHHEKLTGDGYPRQLTSENIPIQARMMTIADIYDALTSSDRPYKRAVTIEKALNILEMEAREGKIDSDILKIFIDKKVFEVVNRETK